MDKISSYLKEYSYLKSIQNLLHWDLEAMMPPGAIEDRAARLSYVEGKIHSLVTSRKYESMLKEVGEKKLTRLEKKLLQELKWDFSLKKALPGEYVKELSVAQAMATHQWSRSREKNDWKSFRPHLQKLIELKRREARYIGGKRPYDALLLPFDKEFSSKEIKGLFSELSKGLISLATKVRNERIYTHVRDLKGPFPLNSQKSISIDMARAFGLPAENSRLDVSSHPFSINISPLDQRITTRYDEAHLDSLSSTMHEVGHALYELNLPREWEGTPFAEAVSYSVHESQSRFWENVIGRSRPFMTWLHPIMKKYFPGSMKGIDADGLYRYFNKSVPGLIRVESSELYYNFHIIIRFEIEEMIFNEGLSVDDIPEIWATKYNEYLGLKVPDYKTGVLQDSHWAGGAFGYFPTYTLGNLISGSLYQRCRKEIPSFEDKIKAGEFISILSWLKDTVHSKGRALTVKELVGELAVKDYLKYLDEKFKG